jgi:ABC-2 type transport system ATP-binding protein
VGRVAGAGVILQLSGVALGYGGRTVLRDLDLQVERGRWIALVGPNASGKTTLLRCAAGQLPPDRGIVQLQGSALYPVKGWRPELPGYAVSPEELPPFLTLRQCLEIHAAAHALEGIPAHTAVLYEELGLRSFDDLLVRSASLGTRQKLAVVLALMRDAPLLLLDEVFNGLDFGSALTLKDHLRKRVQGGLSILLATHALDVVIACCDGLLLDSGRPVRLWDAAGLRGFRSTVELERALAEASRDAATRPA